MFVVLFLSTILHVQMAWCVKKLTIVHIQLMNDSWSIQLWICMFVFKIIAHEIVHFLFCSGYQVGVQDGESTKIRYLKWMIAWIIQRWIGGISLPLMIIIMEMRITSGVCMRRRHTIVTMCARVLIKSTMIDCMFHNFFQQAPNHLYNQKTSYLNIQ
jgi:hypothetical protein